MLIRHYIKTLLFFILPIGLMLSAQADSRSFLFKGKLTSEKKSVCSSGKAQLFISVADSHSILYQVDVIPGGSFQFKLIPGQYQVRAITSSGCEGLYVLSADEKTKDMNVEILLKPQKRASK